MRQFSKQGFFSSNNLRFCILLNFNFCFVLVSKIYADEFNLIKTNIYLKNS